MTYVLIEYDSIMELILKFREINLYNTPEIDEDSNFVIVNPDTYNGRYGGIFFYDVIESFEKRNMSFIHDSLTPTLSLVWWQCNSNIVGDLSLCRNDYSLITKNMFKKLTKKIVYEKLKSSYF